ncbi:MAG TPA: hypothetical protein VFH45_02780 [Acidimicrobiales bacterium]|nr:hypothetical protein [Acidimicrobiales bacterium]
MTHPLSLRFREPSTLEGLKREAAAGSRSVSALAEELIEEGLRMRRHPGVVFRGGPSGRRAGLVDGPDVWEVIEGVLGADLRAADRLERAGEVFGLRRDQVETALSYYAEYTGEVDELITANAAAAAEAEKLWRRRQELLDR